MPLSGETVFILYGAPIFDYGSSAVVSAVAVVPEVAALSFKLLLIFKRVRRAVVGACAAELCEEFADSVVAARERADGSGGDRVALSV